VSDKKALDDTWTFNPVTKSWREIKPPVSPPRRGNHKIVWHDKLGALVMAGPTKLPDNEALIDLWVYETAAERWTEVKTATAPPPCEAATCYDASQNLLVLFNQKGQTWVCRIEREEAKK
jgi:N-acetylneuraminic acid mutarotase